MYNNKNDQEIKKKLGEIMVNATKEKEIALNYIKENNYNEAEERITKAIDLVDSYLYSFKTGIVLLREIIQPELMDKILFERKMMYANYANIAKLQKDYDKAIQIDQQVLLMDNEFDESCFRIIECSLHKQDLKKANFYADLAKKQFSNDLLNKYDNIFELLNQKNKEIELGKKNSEANIKEEVNNIKAENINKVESNNNKEEIKKEEEIVNNNYWSKFFKSYYKHFAIFLSLGAIIYIVYRKRKQN